MEKDKKQFIMVIGMTSLVSIFLGAIVAGTLLKPGVEQIDKIFALMNSKAIADIVVVGQISEIKERTLTIRADNELLPVPIKEDAKIVDMLFPLSYPMIGFIVDVSDPYNMNYIDFAQLQTGDTVNIYLEIDGNGDYKGKTVLKFLGTFPYEAPISE